MAAPVENLRGWSSLSPELRERFLGADLPAVVLGGVFELAKNLEYDGPELLRFGYGNGEVEGDFCLDLVTAAVHLYRPGDLPPLFVNTTLGQFGQSVRLVLDRERELTTGDRIVCEEVAREITHDLAELDPDTNRTDTYWAALTFELAEGTYSKS